MYGDDSWMAELRCPIPPRLCPHADVVQDWLVDWADRVGGPLDATARDRLARTGVARYAGRLYPDASEADLRVLAALFTWFFLVDDACDAARRPRPAEVAALCDGALRLLRLPPSATPPPATSLAAQVSSPPPATPLVARPASPPPATPSGTRPASPPPATPSGTRPASPPPTTPAGVPAPRTANRTAAGPVTRPGNQPAARLTAAAQSRATNQPVPRPEAFDGPLRRMLADAWQVPQHRMPAAWRDRFVDAVAHHLAGVVTEATNKACGRPPSVAEYLPLRRATSAAYVSYTLIEFATGRPLPDAVYHHPAVRETAATANDLLSWFNDLLSLDRDTLTSGGHNLVLAVAREERVPVDVAVRSVVRRWQRCMRRFIELRDAVPSFGPALDGPLRDYLDGLANSVRGTLDWSLESARYRAGSPAAHPAEALVDSEPQRRPG